MRCVPVNEISSELCISLVYVSSAVRLFERGELLTLVAQAQHFNHAHGLTGMLLHKDGNFMQVLEGPEVAVTALMEKISADDRHSRLLTLVKRQIDERSFSDWSMGFRDLNTLSMSEAEIFQPYLSCSLAGDLYKTEPAAALKLLKSFTRQNSR